MKKKLLFTFAGLSLLTASAQDIHFSQYGFSPINTNPANTGLFDGDFRAGAIYRTQWWQIPGLPYSTVSFFGDMRQGQKKLKSDRLGVGFMFNNDVAGASKYGTTQIYIPVSYVAKISADSSMLLSVALKPGISSTGFKTSALTFDTQYDGLQYQSALPSQENFTNTNNTKLDINAGTMFQYSYMQRGYVQAGLSLDHITTQKISYFSNSTIKLDMKTNAYLLANYPISQEMEVNFEMLYSHQGKFHELVTGANFKYIMPAKIHEAVFFGAYVRPKDAFIARVGLEYKSWRYSMAYDVNTSGFKAATNKQGALEFGLIYIFKKVVPFVAKKRVCPVYM